MYVLSEVRFQEGFKEGLALKSFTSHIYCPEEDPYTHRRVLSSRIFERTNDWFHRHTCLWKSHRDPVQWFAVVC